MRVLTVALLLLGTIANAQPPEWTQNAERRVIGGDIIHWGTGGAPSSEVALFKARQMAIKALIEECGGIAHKDIVPRKQYVEPDGLEYRAYSTVSLSFDSCDASKRGGKSLENPKIVESQKLYDEMLHGKKEEVDVRDQVRELMRDTSASHDEDISELRNEVEQLKIMVKQPIVQQPVTLPATDSMKSVCWTEYGAMMDDLRGLAADYHGNMAAPELVPRLNMAERKKGICQRLR